MHENFECITDAPATRRDLKSVREDVVTLGEQCAARDERVHFALQHITDEILKLRGVGWRNINWHQVALSMALTVAISYFVASRALH
jgi:hypothetical protein